jgi:hypothetical protein
MRKVILDLDELMKLKEESSANGAFILEDLPYHMRRVYLRGTNSIGSPWSLYDDIEFEFEMPILGVFDEFDGIAKFGVPEKCFLLILKYYYYPFYYILFTYLK